MFREMRRIKQLLPLDEARSILVNCTSGVLAVSGDDGYPYTVPVSYACEDDKIYIHSATEGHKIDGIKRNDKVSFCVIDKDEVQTKTFSTHYRSVTIFGRARILTDDEERRNALMCITEKYSPDNIEEGKQEMARNWDRVCLIEVKIEHMTGKAARGLINNGV